MLELRFHPDGERGVGEETVGQQLRHARVAPSRRRRHLAAQDDQAPRADGGKRLGGRALGGRGERLRGWPPEQHLCRRDVNEGKETTSSLRVVARRVQGVRLIEDSREHHDAAAGSRGASHATSRVERLRMQPRAQPTHHGRHVRAAAAEACAY